MQHPSSETNGAPAGASPPEPAPPSADARSPVAQDEPATGEAETKAKKKKKSLISMQNSPSEANGAPAGSSSPEQAFLSTEAQPLVPQEGPAADQAEAKVKKKKKQKHKMRIEHQTLGRVRMKFVSAKGDQAQLEEIGETFSAIPGIERVTVNPDTGSVVLHYDHERHTDFHRHFERQINQIPAPPPTQLDEFASKVEREAEFLAEHSETAKAIVHICKRFDHEIKQKSNNAVDLKIGFGVGIIAFTLLEVGASAATPVWLTLGVFTLNHFIELQTRHDLEAQIKKNEKRLAPVVVKAPKAI
jgi:hypothetical protein